MSNGFPKSVELLFPSLVDRLLIFYLKLITTMLQRKIVTRVQYETIKFEIFSIEIQNLLFDNLRDYSTQIDPSLMNY